MGCQQYPHYPQMYVRLFREKNPRLVFYNTHTHLFERESYSSLVRNHCSLFSIPLHYHTLRGDLYPNTIHTFLECSECFVSLRSFGDLPKEASEAWRMQPGILQDLESQTRHNSDKPCWSRSLEGLGALGRLGLEGLLLFVYPNLFSSGSIYHLEGGGDIFRRVLQFPL